LRETNAVTTGKVKAVSAFAARQRETRKTGVEVDSSRSFRLHTDILANKRGKRAVFSVTLCYWFIIETSQVMML
jgi:hypothetical protein